LTNIIVTHLESPSDISRVANDLHDIFFSNPLNPVAPKAQKRVPIPEGLDLDNWIHEPPPEVESDSNIDDLEETYTEVLGLPTRIHTSYSVYTILVTRNG
jgi:hypothetical protein